MLLYPVSVSPGDCAEYMLYALLQGESGAFRRKPRAEIIKGPSPYGEARQSLWEHTITATSVDAP
ncbi:hypothetical protein BV22DRAFT_1028901 [Leucogyrophana mollusca]|nr:hypothetical protein BV22DRAFT_1028901 [Leucogyrophana mollusca]